MVAAHMAVGYLVALPPAEWSVHLGRLILGMGAWVILLNGGTLAFNSAFDNDSGDIGYLDSPPPVPRALWLVSLLLMLAGAAVSLAVTIHFAAAYVICLALSLLYSTPPIRLKARAGFDLIINMLGYGALTTFAGWACARAETSPGILLLCGGYALLFACLYPLTQIYQYDEDLANNDTTLTVALGPRRAVLFAVASLIGAFVLFYLAAPLATLPALLLTAALACWLGVLIPWLVRGRSYPEKRGMYRALWAWGLTDVLMVVAFAV